MADDIADLAGETVKSVGHALTGDIFRKRKSSVNNLGKKKDLKLFQNYLNFNFKNYWLIFNKKNLFLV